MSSRQRDQTEMLKQLANALADQPRASMEQLASMIGISRATLCRYFPSRESMMRALSEAGISSAEQALARARPQEGPVEDVLLRLVEEFLPIAELYACVDPELHGDEESDARLQPLRNSLIASFLQWQSSGALRVDLPAAWLVESMLALLCRAATMIRAGRLARQDATAAVFKLLWEGVSKKDAQHLRHTHKRHSALPF